MALSELLESLFCRHDFSFFLYSSPNARYFHTSSASHINQRDISTFPRPCFTTPWFELHFSDTCCTVRYNYCVRYLHRSVASCWFYRHAASCQQVATGLLFSSGENRLAGWGLAVDSRALAICWNNPIKTCY
jgi:hypothetical protein